ncbi:MAG: hypothetical protein JO332_14465 [Planctomycetaceae bacterium]|nr:hypothetical protein [Planctomycetaceae bacterium]
MMPHGSRTSRTALAAGRALALVLLLVSPRALYSPAEPVHKSQDSKRPKTPKNIVRAEPVRVPAAARQGQGPGLEGSHASAEELTYGPARGSAVLPLPRDAFTQLTRPEYLKSFSAGIPSHPLSPPGLS